MAPNRSGAAAALCASAVKLGTIDSRNGSAKVVPSPRRMVRRGKARPVVNITKLLAITQRRVQEDPPTDGGSERTRPTCTQLFWRIWNGALFTTPSTSDENR